MIIIVQPPPFVKGIFIKSYEEFVNSGLLSAEPCFGKNLPRRAAAFLCGRGPPPSKPFRKQPGRARRAGLVICPTWTQKKNCHFWRPKLTRPGGPAFKEGRKGLNDMPIIYDKLFEMLEKRRLTVWVFHKEKVIGDATIEKLRNNRGNIDTRTIVRLCKYLQCQPGDIMEYVEGEDE